MDKIKIQRNAFDEYALKSCDNAFATLMGIFYYIKIPFWSMQSNLRVAIKSDALWR